MGYFSTWTERVEARARLLAPYGFMAVLFVFSVVSFSFPLAGSVKAPLLLMAIYYWAIYRPTLIPVWLVFATGVLVDLIGGQPLGLTALVFVLVQWVVTDQRRFLMGQSFFVLWLGFTTMSFAAGLLQWGVFGLLSAGWPSLNPLWFSIFLGVALFPLVSVLLHLTHKILPESRSDFMLKTKSR